MIWITAALGAGMDDVAKTAEMSAVEVQSLLEGVSKDDTVLARMAKPYEGKPWHAYRKLFLTPARIEGGRTFLNTHAALLSAAEEKSGVPASVITAIIGVETAYGSNMGGDAVVTALYTLGFHHKRRGAFFRKELGHYLRLATDNAWDLHQTRGSYAGAMGMGQFMPSSTRAYAVDGDGDGRIDLFGSHADAIHSVANYLAEHGWKTGGRVLDAPKGNPRRSGATVTGRAFLFDGESGPELMQGHGNFEVILTYNRSPLYARAVWDLAQALE